MKKTFPALPFLILFSVFWGLVAQAQHSEILRLKGFAEHQINQKKFDRERLKGESEFTEEVDAWEHQKQQDLIEYKKQQAKQKAKDDKGLDYKADLEERQSWIDDYEISRKNYSKEIQKFDRSHYKDLVSEETELDIKSERPRYALKSRVMYGAKSKFGKSTISSGASSNSGGSFNGNSGSGSASFPPPPTFDDFNDGGFIPPAGFDGFGDDIPPPPPPPPMPFDQGDESMPMPPPNFDDGFGGF